MKQISFRSFRNLHNVCTSPYFYQHWIKSLFSTMSSWYLLFSDFCITAIITGMRKKHIVLFVCIIIMANDLSMFASKCQSSISSLEKCINILCPFLNQTVLLLLRFYYLFIDYRYQSFFCCIIQFCFGLFFCLSLEPYFIYSQIYIIICISKSHLRKITPGHI